MFGKEWTLLQWNEFPFQKLLKLPGLDENAATVCQGKMSIEIADNEVIEAKMLEALHNIRDLGDFDQVSWNYLPSARKAEKTGRETI